MSVQLCCYCQKFLRGCFVLCHDCSHSPPVHLCLENESSLRIFGWSSLEVTALLDAIDLYSFDNWKDISKSLSSRSPQDCQSFYTNYFINGNVGKATLASCKGALTPQDHTDGPSSSSSSEPLADVSLREQQEVGYMPLRDEFEMEYDASMEDGMKDLHAGGVDEDEVDRAYRIMKAESYREKLKERELKKRVAKEINIFKKLSASKMQFLSKKKSVKEEREMKDRWKAYTRFHKDFDNDEKHVSALIRQKRLVKRIHEMVLYRRSGLTRLFDCREFENAKLLRDKEVEIISKMENLSSPKNNSLSASTLLSKREKKMCKAYNLTTALYLALKLHLLQGKSKDVDLVWGLGSRRVSEFLKANNWLIT